MVGRQALRDEVERAAGQLREVRVVLRGVDDHRRALEVIRDRRHDLVLIGMGGPRDAQRVAEFADDVAHLDAHVSVVG